MTKSRHTWGVQGAAIGGYANAEVHHIPLNRLQFPFQSDAATDEDKVMSNVRRMKDQESLGPVIIDGGYGVLDGHHKVKAAERMGYTHAPCCVSLGMGDFPRAAANARYRLRWNGLQKSMELLHGTHPDAAESIVNDGFKVGSDGYDFGNAVYFKSHSLDDSEDNEITEAEPVIHRFEQGAIVHARLKGAKVLDLRLPRNKPHVQHINALRHVWTGTGSPYETYAKQHGYDAIIGNIPSKPDEGHVVAVYNPDKLEPLGIQEPYHGEVDQVLEKSMNSDLTGGRWVTIMHNHVYIKDGKIVAGHIPTTTTKGETVNKKMSKADMATHQQYYDAQQKAANPVKAQPKAAEPTQYHAFHNGEGYKPVDGKRVDLGHQSLHLFMHKKDGMHYINEASSGRVVGSGKTPTLAKNNAKEALDRNGGMDAAHAAIQAHIAQHGESPTTKGLDNAEKPANTKGKAKGGTDNGGTAGQSNGGENSTGGEGAAGAVGQGGQEPGGDRSTDSEFSVKGAKVVNHIPEHGMYEVKGHKAFHKAITDAKNAHADGHGAMVHAYSPEEYKDKRLFLNKDGTHGFALAKDGDIVSVFKHPTKGQKGALSHIMMTALKNGGNKLDAFGGGLQDMYGKYGFDAKAQLPFDKEYAPEGWNYDKLGEPPVVFMKHNGDSPEDVAKKDYPKIDMSKVPTAKDYDHATALQSGAAQPEPDKPAEPETPKIPAKPAEKDSRITGKHRDFMRGRPELDLDAAKPYASTPYTDKPVPANAKGAVKEAFAAARKHADVRDFARSLSDDTRRTLAKAGIDEARFHGKNASEEATIKAHAQSMLGSAPKIDAKDAAKASDAMKAQLGEHHGVDGDYHVYHGTSMPKVRNIIKHGFGLNGDHTDFGNAAYFKSPAFDKYDRESKGADSTKSLINDFARQSGEHSAVVKCKITGGKVLDCKKDGRPPELDSLIKNWHAKPDSNESAAAIDRGKRRALLHYEGKADASQTKDLSDDHIGNLIKQHYGADDDQDVGKLMAGTSPYELYAKHHGYDAVVDKLDQYKNEGWQIGVYNPSILKVVDVGKRLTGDDNGVKLEKSLNTDSGARKKGKQPPHCLLHFGYEKGAMHLYVGAQDDRPAKADSKLVKSIRVRNIL